MRIPVSLVARAVSGESSCLHRLWWEIRNSRPPADETQLAVWKMAHSRAVRKTATELDGTIHAEVPFHHESGLTGRVDLVQMTEERTVLHEVKTGRATASDIVQLMIYMSLARGKIPNEVSGVLHRARSKTEVPLADVPHDMIERAREVADVLQSSTPPPRLQERACSWCRAACPHAINGATDTRTTAGRDSAHAGAE